MTLELSVPTPAEPPHSYVEPDIYAAAKAACQAYADQHRGLTNQELLPELIGVCILEEANTSGAIVSIVGSVTSLSRKRVGAVLTSNAKAKTRLPLWRCGPDGRYIVNQPGSS